MSKPEQSNSKTPENIRCGIVMPISATEDCSKEHWKEVFAILEEALDDTGFKPELVSDRDDSGIIQATIVQRLADDPIVICDVSARNPNVMFELGLRLAFDKATIVIKDDKTDYPFDMTPLQYLEYPRTLHHPTIQEFIRKLALKVKATHKASQEAGYSTYLKQFVKVTPKNIPAGEEDFARIVLSELSALRREISSSKQDNPAKKVPDIFRNTAFTATGPIDALGSFREAALAAKLVDAFLLNPVNSHEIQFNVAGLSNAQLEQLLDLALERGLDIRRMR